MSLLIFAVIVLIVAALLVWAVDIIPLDRPANIVLKVAIILVAVIVICNRAGFV